MASAVEPRSPASPSSKPGKQPPPPPPPPSDGVLSPSSVFRIALLSGAVAGFTVDSVLFPLDTLKTRLQLATAPIATTAAAPAAGVAAAATKALSQNPAKWLAGLYAGFGPAVIASAPAAATFFGVYDYAKRRLSDTFPQHEPRYAPAFHMLAAAAGDVASSTLRVPFEVVKQRLQSGMYTSPMSAVSAIMRNEGMRGFFTGYSSLLIRELPFDALQFPLYEYLKTVVARQRGRPLHTWENSLCGSVAGGVAATITTPLDVVKTRLMTQGADVQKYHGIVHGLRTIAKEEGAQALMAGVVPRVLWISWGGAIFFGAYEAAKKAVTPVIAKREALEAEKSHKM